MASVHSLLKHGAFAVIVAAAVLTMSDDAQAQSCASSSQRTVDARGPVTLTGTLRRGRGEHPARGRFTYYYLELSTPVCVSNVENISDESRNDHPNVARLQIMNPPRPRVGRSFTVTGMISHSHTAWHVEQLLLIP